jgi:hypothetical protein
MEKRSLVWGDDNSDEAKKSRAHAKVSAQKLYGLVRSHIDASLPLEMEAHPYSMIVTFTLDGLIHQSTSFYESARVRDIDGFARHLARELLMHWVTKKYWLETRS